MLRYSRQCFYLEHTLFITWYPYIWCKTWGTFDKVSANSESREKKKLTRVYVYAHFPESHTHFLTYLCVFLCVAICQHWHFLKSLLDTQTMASLYVLSCGVIIGCLSLCVFVCVMCECACSLFNKEKKKSHCVTTACLVPSCFRGEGKTGRIRGGMSMAGGGLRWNYIRQWKETAANSVCFCDCHLLMRGWNQQMLRGKKDMLRFQRMFVTVMLSPPMKQVAFKIICFAKRAISLIVDAEGK